MHIPLGGAIHVGAYISDAGPLFRIQVHGLAALASAGSSVTSHPLTMRVCQPWVLPKKRRNYQTSSNKIYYTKPEAGDFRSVP